MRELTPKRAQTQCRVGQKWAVSGDALLERRPGVVGWGEDWSVSGSEDKRSGLSSAGCSAGPNSPRWLTFATGVTHPRFSLKPRDNYGASRRSSGRRPIITCGSAAAARLILHLIWVILSIFRGNHLSPVKPIRCVCKQCKWERWQMALRLLHICKGYSKCRRSSRFTHSPRCAAALRSSLFTVWGKFKADTDAAFEREDYSDVLCLLV